MKYLLLLFSLFLICFSANSQQNYVYRLDSYLNSYEHQKAISLADSVLHFDSSDQIIIAKTRALSSLYRFREAASILKDKFRQDTLNKLFLIELMQLSRQTGNTDEAISYNEKLVKYYPGNTIFKLQLATLYMNDKRYQAAKELLIPVYLKDTVNYYVIKQIATCYDELDQLYSARIFYYKALEVSPFDPVITNRLANVLIKNGKYKEANTVAASCLANDSTFMPVRKQFAYTFYLLREYSPAITEFRKCISLGDTSVFSLKYLGLCFYRQ